MFISKTMIYQAISAYWSFRKNMNVKLYQLGLRDMNAALTNVDYYASKKFNAIDKYLK